MYRGRRTAAPCFILKESEVIIWQTITKVLNTGIMRI